MMLAAQDIAVHLRGAAVLRDVSAEFRPGSITAICGPNGAGKSTLLSVLAGLTDPASGSVTLDGQALSGLSARSRAQSIGYLPQAGDVAWDVSVRNLVTLGRLPHGDEGAKFVEAALEAVHLTDMAARPISTLSGGEKARALLARVFAGDPQWVLADEPLAALDFFHQHEVLASLRAAAGQGKGVVLVLHDLALAMNHADRVLVLEKGAVVADGPPEQALGVETIMRTWGVSARWLGDPGARALVAG